MVIVNNKSYRVGTVLLLLVHPFICLYCATSTMCNVSMKLNQRRSVVDLPVDIEIEDRVVSYFLCLLYMPSLLF